EGPGVFLLGAEYVRIDGRHPGVPDRGLAIVTELEVAVALGFLDRRGSGNRLLAAKRVRLRSVGHQGQRQSDEGSEEEEHARHEAILAGGGAIVAPRRTEVYADRGRRHNPGLAA